MNINSKKWISTFLIFVVVMAQSLVPTIAKAQELNAMGFVDSFNIEKTDLYYGERTKINVNFSEKDGYKLQPGDVLTLTLPPELKGFNGKIPLDDYGVCEVSAGVAKCIFNEKVSTRNNIRGFFTINVQATNVETDQKKEIQTNLGTNLEMQKVTITGPSSGGGSGEGTKGPFSYKAGDIQPDNTDEVRWFLMVNYNKEVLNTDIKLSDSLQEGQKFNKDSFSISVDNAAGQKSLSLKDFESQGYGTIEFVNDMTFKAIFNKDKANGTRFSISYKADITEAGKKIQKLENKYAIEYQVVDNEAVSDSQVAQVENITAEGGAEGDLNATTSIAGTKTWKGDKVNDRPKAIKVDLIQNDKVIETKEVTETSDWKYEFENLRVFDSEGKAYKYEVKEQPVSGYQSKVNGYDITNVKIHEGKEETLEENWETTEELEDQPKPEKPEIKEEENHLETPKEEKPQVEGEGKEETLEENWETTEELEEQPKPEKPEITEEENHLETPKEEKPQVEGEGKEETLEENWETTEELEDQPKPEKPEITEEENHLETPKEEKPQVEGEGKEETLEENWETTEELEDQPKPEKPEIKEEENHLETPKEEKPKVEGEGKEETLEENWETTEELEDQPKPEKPEIKEEENHLETPKEEKPQVEGEGKEETLEENWETTEELEEQPKPEKPEITEEENHLETPKEEKPQVEGEGKEETLEENWETTEELEDQPKPEKPEITEEENHLETPKEEKPQVEGEGKEETLEENWETTEELEDQPKPEKPEITEEENHLETPKEEKPKVEGEGKEETLEENWETTEELEDQPKPEKPEITEEENHLANPKEENPEVKEEIKPSENPKEENPEVKEEVKPSENPKEENPEVKEEVKPSENAKEERQTPEKSEGAGKQLPQTGGHKAYEPFLGGALIVFGLLMLVMNKRRYN